MAILVRLALGIYIKIYVDGGVGGGEEGGMKVLSDLLMEDYTLSLYLTKY